MDHRENLGEREELAIPLYPLLRRLLRHWWVYILSGLVAGILAVIFAMLFITPLYQSSFSAYVDNYVSEEEKMTISNADLTASRYLTQSYVESISSRRVLNTAAENVGLKLDYETLSEMVSAACVPDTEIISVNVTGGNPAVVKQLAEEILKIAEVETAGIVDGSSMRIIDVPEMPEKPCSPDYFVIVSYACAGGFLIPLIACMLQEMDHLSKKYHRG